MTKEEARKISKKKTKLTLENVSWYMHPLMQDPLEMEKGKGKKNIAKCKRPVTPGHVCFMFHATHDEKRSKRRQKIRK